MDRYAGKVPPACQLLLGPRYALLREEFQRARATLRRRSAPVTSVLVSFGGADVENRTGVAIEALLALGAPIPAVDVLIGACHAHRSEIESACRRHGFRCHVQSSQVADLMAAADLAIGAGGSTTWERCCMGLPALVVPIAANQRGVVEAAALQGLVYTPAGGDVTAASLALHLKALLDNPRLLEMMSRNGMQAVDGRGADRVVRALDHDSIRIREATLDDAHALFEWRNHESIRAVSRRPDPIAWPEHQAWLRSVLADDDRLLLIGERDGVPVGVVRFDVSCHDADVSIYRVPGSAESGVGSSLLAAAETWLNARRPDLESLTADVLGENDRSHHLFRSTGYELHSAQYRKRLHLS